MATVNATFNRTPNPGIRLKHGVYYENYLTIASLPNTDLTAVPAAADRIPIFGAAAIYFICFATTTSAGMDLVPGAYFTKGGGGTRIPHVNGMVNPNTQLIYDADGVGAWGDGQVFRLTPRSQSGVFLGSGMYILPDELDLVVDNDVDPGGASVTNVRIDVVVQGLPMNA